MAENNCQWGLTQLWWHNVTLMHVFFPSSGIKIGWSQADQWTATGSVSVSVKVGQFKVNNSKWIRWCRCSEHQQATTSECFSAQRLLANVTPAWAGMMVYRHAVAEHRAELEATHDCTAISCSPAAAPPAGLEGRSCGGSECAVEEAWFKHTPWAPSSTSSSSSPLSKMRGGAREAYAFFNEGPLFCCYGHRTQGGMGKDGKR